MKWIAFYNFLKKKTGLNQQIENIGKDGERLDTVIWKCLLTRAAVSHLQTAVTEAPPFLQVVHGAGMLDVGGPILKPAGGGAVAKRTVLSFLVRLAFAKHKVMVGGKR